MLFQNHSQKKKQGNSKRGALFSQQQWAKLDTSTHGRERAYNLVRKKGCFANKVDCAIYNDKEEEDAQINQGGM